MTAEKSLRLQRQEESVAKLEEFKELAKLKKKKEELELEKIQIKFLSCHSIFKDTTKDDYNIYKNGETLGFPRFSCIQEKMGKKTLRTLLIERSKKADWLGLSKEDQKTPNWITKINPELQTKVQLSYYGQDNEKGANAAELVDMLKKYKLIGVI